MTREEFMTELASMLQDISVEERVEAMQYYNDYFDDAGEKQEEQIAAELGSPEKVAAEVKAGLERNGDETSEYRETGYADTRFEEQENLAKREEKAEKSEEYSYHYAENAADAEDKEKKDKTVKIVAIVLVALVVIPILLPVAVGVLGALFGVVAAIVSALIALVILAIALVIVGVVLFLLGITSAVSQLPVGLALFGLGLILSVVGVVLAVAFVKLCFVVFPKIGKGIRKLWKKIVEKRKAVA